MMKYVRHIVEDSLYWEILPVETLVWGYVSDEVNRRVQAVHREVQD